ncbi:hypothetical protein ID866_8078 [Astraeus odoratus]|nr:hypothetical protein ID866_8078 [Astraeus odoratus]
MPSQLDLPSVTDFVAFSILYYDFLLTFGKEVEFFWTKPRKSWAFALFMTNRYVTILSHIHPYLEIFWPLNEGEDGALSVVFCDRDRLTDIRYSCRIADVYDQFEIIVVQIIGGGIMIMRVYALYEKSRRVLFFLVAYALICIGIGCLLTIIRNPRYGQWSVLAPSSSDSPPVPTPPLHYGCNVPITFDQAQHMAIAWSGQLAFDAIIFLLTLSRTLRIGKLGNRTLLDVLIRDGALYFGIMTAANAGNITAFLVQYFYVHVRLHLMISARYAKLRQ